MGGSIAFLCLVFSSCILSASAAACHSGDRAALLAIDKHLGSPQALSTWRAPQTDCCSWDFVGCYQSNRVQFLQLQKISGTIPPAVGDLPKLRTLIIDSSPELTGTIPYSITKLKEITSLILDNNALSGPIPDYLSQLTTLEQLDLSKNKFSGSIPPSFSKLNKLSGLILSNNQLTGHITDFSGSGSDYRFIDLSHNKLTGPIPKSLAKLGAKSVDVSYNKLSGDASFLFETNLRTLNLKRNHFKFDLSGVHFPVGLFQLQLDHNEIYGSIPAQINDLPLTALNLSYNSLCGEIPPGLATSKFGASSFVHNKCLCGSPLPACK